MSTGGNKAVFREIVEEVINRGIWPLPIDSSPPITSTTPAGCPAARAILNSSPRFDRLFPTFT